MGESCALLLALKALGQALARYMSDYKGSRGFNHRSDLSAGTESHILTLYLLQVPRTVRVPAQHLAFFFFSANPIYVRHILFHVYYVLPFKEFRRGNTS